MTVQIESNVKDPERIRERRQQIVEAAVRLFSDKGFHKTTTREIAKESGLSNGALYEYVASKEDVLFLVCQHIHGEVRKQLLANQETSVNAAVKLREAIRGLFVVVQAMQADILLIYQEAKSLPRPYLREVLHQEQAIVNIFEDLLWQGVKDGSLAIRPESIPLCAQNIVVTGQMLAFRRWALQDVTFHQFCNHQIRMLLLACGAMDSLDSES